VYPDALIAGSGPGPGRAADPTTEVIVGDGSNRGPWVTQPRGAVCMRARSDRASLYGQPWRGPTVEPDRSRVDPRSVDHHLDHHQEVNGTSPAQSVCVRLDGDLRIRTGANPCGPSADDWGQGVAVGRSHRERRGGLIRPGPDTSATAHRSRRRWTPRDDQRARGGVGTAHLAVPRRHRFSSVSDGPPPARATSPAGRCRQQQAAKSARRHEASQTHRPRPLLPATSPSPSARRGHAHRQSSVESSSPCEPPVWVPVTLKSSPTRTVSASPSVVVMWAS
jgi:hypothetical protein